MFANFTPSPHCRDVFRSGSSAREQLSAAGESVSFGPSADRSNDCAPARACFLLVPVSRRACLVQGRELAEGTVVGFHEGKARQPNPAARGPLRRQRKRPSNNARRYGEAMGLFSRSRRSRPRIGRARSREPSRAAGAA